MRNSSSKLFLSSLVIFLLLGCGFSTEKRRPPVVEEGMKDRGIKFVSEAEIFEQAVKMGDSITSQAQSILLAQLSQKIGDGDFVNAVNYCARNAQQLTDSVGNQFHVKLKRVSLKNRNGFNAPTPLERNVLEAYSYSHERDGEIGKNIQFYSNEDSILFNKPIFLASPLCLNCHGDKEQIKAEVADILDEVYPNDSARNYQVGDLRGMWSVAFAKKQLVKAL